MGEETKKLIGKITHYYSKIGVAVVELSDTIKVGDEIGIEGNVTQLRQKVVSMQIEHKDVMSAASGQSIGLRVETRVREGDLVYEIVV